MVTKMDHMLIKMDQMLTYWTTTGAQPPPPPPPSTSIKETTSPSLTCREIEVEPVTPSPHTEALTRRRERRRQRRQRQQLARREERQQHRQRAVPRAANCTPFRGTIPHLSSLYPI